MHRWQMLLLGKDVTGPEWIVGSLRRLRSWRERS